MERVSEIFTKILPYRVELVLIILALFITSVSGGLIFFLSEKDNSVPTIVKSVNAAGQKQQSKSETRSKVKVEISGAVVSPDVYELESGSRLSDVLNLAGGLTDTADKEYVARNFNLAKYVGDQEKIYIPYTWDIENGTFVEESRILSYLDPANVTTINSKPNSSNSTPPPSPQISGISINDGTQVELEALPGVGPSTATKIIKARPYQSKDELITRGIVKQSVYDQILPMIGL